MQATGEGLRREDAIRQYGPMVRRVATQMVSRLPANVELDDLVQAGMIGLFDSLSRYQAGLGAQFETFAMQRIRGAMIDELRDADWLPRSARRNRRSIDGAIRRLEQSLQRPPAEREVAQALGVALDEYQRMLGGACGAQLVCLDEIAEGAADEDLAARNGAGDDDDPSRMLRDARFREALVAAIEDLPERERALMGMYYDRDMSLKEIGAALGVTESRVSQLHGQAVARLRVRLRGWA